MNYYEHHIGDFAEATAHLSFVEDAAYSRLIRKYYASESPLPVDLKQVQRLVGARSREEKCAVQTVLEEFFILREDGWHQERCDREIAEFLAGEPERAVKKVNEETRLKRHREERARLFSLLNDAGQHAPWNISMNELRALVQRHCNGPATAPATRAPPLPATAPATPATATQTPYPDTIPSSEEKMPRVAAQPPPRPPDVETKVWADFMAMRKAKRSPLTQTALDGIKREAAKADVTLAEAIAACCEYGWQAFNAGWYAERQAKTKTNGTADRRATTLAGLTGQPHGAAHGRTRGVIEVPATVVAG